MPHLRFAVHVPYLSGSFSVQIREELLQHRAYRWEVLLDGFPRETVVHIAVVVD